mgnify:CR=1 FL=1
MIVKKRFWRNVLWNLSQGDIKYVSDNAHTRYIERMDYDGAVCSFLCIAGALLCLFSFFESLAIYTATVSTFTMALVKLHRILTTDEVTEGDA